MEPTGDGEREDALYEWLITRHSWLQRSWVFWGVTQRLSNPKYRYPKYLYSSNCSTGFLWMVVVTAAARSSNLPVNHCMSQHLAGFMWEVISDLRFRANLRHFLGLVWTCSFKKCHYVKGGKEPGQWNSNESVFNTDTAYCLIYINLLCKISES